VFHGRRIPSKVFSFHRDFFTICVFRFLI
jgi:hypothetical protein